MVVCHVVGQNPLNRRGDHVVRRQKQNKSCPALNSTADLPFCQSPSNLDLLGASSGPPGPHEGAADTQVGNKGSQHQHRSPPGVALDEELDRRGQDEGPDSTT